MENSKIYQLRGIVELFQIPEQNPISKKKDVVERHQRIAVQKEFHLESLWKSKAEAGLEAFLFIDKEIHYASDKIKNDCCSYKISANMKHFPKVSNIKKIN